MGQPGTALALTDREILEEIGLRLKSMRYRRKLGQKDVAKATGIEVSTLSRYESGRAKSPSLTKMIRLVEFYDVSYDWLLADLSSTRVNRDGNVPGLYAVEGNGSEGKPIQLPTMSGV